MTTSKKQNPDDNTSPTLRRARIMTIVIAASFIAGGTAGYFTGRYTSQMEAEREATTPPEEPLVTDSIIVAGNQPTDTIVDARQVGPELADSLNRAYRTTANEAASVKH